MGEVKVNVKISNAMDVAMSRRGLIPREQIRTVAVEAVVDTGAVRSCIPVTLTEQLGLETERDINAEMANGQTQSFEMTEAAYIDILGRLATESFLVLGSEVLIGQRCWSPPTCSSIALGRRSSPIPITQPPPSFASAKSRRSFMAQQSL